MGDASLLKLAFERNAKPFGTLTSVGAFISDVLEPIAPFCQYIFYIGGGLTLVALLIYAIVSLLRGRLAPTLLFLCFATFFSGGLYALQGNDSENGYLSEVVPGISTLQQTLGLIQRDIGEIKQNTRVTNEKLDTISQQLATMQHAGIYIPQPNTAAQHLHNARTAYSIGDGLKASHAWQQYFALDKNPMYVDVHQAYQEFLNVSHGRIATRQRYRQQFPADNHVVTDFSRCLLLIEPQRKQCLQAIKRDHDTFAPVYYELSHYWSDSELGHQSLTDKQHENRLLQSFMTHAAPAAGTLYQWYADKQVADSLLSEARQRLAKFNSGKPALNIVALPHNTGWSVTVYPAEPALAIRWKKVGKTQYQDTGTLAAINPHTQQVMAKNSFDLPLLANELELAVQYQDIRHTWQGPFNYVLKPKQQLALHNKKALQQFNQQLIEATQNGKSLLITYGLIAAYHCGVKTVRWGVETLTETLPIEQCDPANPYNATTSYQVYDRTASAIVYQVEYQDGSKSALQHIKVKLAN